MGAHPHNTHSVRSLLNRQASWAGPDRDVSVFPIPAIVCAPSRSARPSGTFPLPQPSHFPSVTEQIRTAISHRHNCCRHYTGCQDRGLLLFLNSMMETSLSFIHFAFSLRGRPISALTGMGRRLSAVEEKSRHRGVYSCRPYGGLPPRHRTVHRPGYLLLQHIHSRVKTSAGIRPPPPATCKPPIHALDMGELMQKYIICPVRRKTSAGTDDNRGATAPLSPARKARG